MTDEKAKPSRRRRICRFTLLHVLIALVFILIAFGAYNATTGTQPSGDSAILRSNGTSDFYPTTILISLDGFRADFLQRRLTPTLSAFIQEGVSPKYMLPSFPSVTFPNHFTLVTGLYPESHGVVGNTFWDPVTEEEFFYTNTSVSMKSKWWLGEPIWQTAEEQNVPTAVHMWPGSEAHINGVDPTHLDRYNGSEELSIKSARILSLLDKPGPKDFNASMDDPRPSLIAAVSLKSSFLISWNFNSTFVSHTDLVQTQSMYPMLMLWGISMDQTVLQFATPL